jgi:hypothetical protein
MWYKLSFQSLLFFLCTSKLKHNEQHQHKLAVFLVAMLCWEHCVHAMQLRKSWSKLCYADTKQGALGARFELCGKSLQNVVKQVTEILYFVIKLLKFCILWISCWNSAFCVEYIAAEILPKYCAKSAKMLLKCCWNLSYSSAKGVLGVEGAILSFLYLERVKCIF